MVIRRFTFAVLLALPLSIASRTWAQEGPLLPGLEPSSSAVESAADAPAIEVEPADQPSLPAYLPPARQERSEVIELPTLADDGITPLDASGQPITGPEQPLLDLPAPPPLPRPSRGVNSGIVDPVPEESEEPKKNLWQKSTEALRNLTRPEPKPHPAQNRPGQGNAGLTKPGQARPSPAQSDNDALRNWQMRRQQPKTVPNPAASHGARGPNPRMQPGQSNAVQPMPPSGARRGQPQGNGSASAAQNPYATRSQQPSSRRVNPAVPRPQTQPSRPGYTPAARQPATSAQVNPNTPRAPWEQDAPRQTSRPRPQRIR